MGKCMIFVKFMKEVLDLRCIANKRPRRLEIATLQAITRSHVP